MRAPIVETLADFPSSLVDIDGVAWVARALGRLRSDGLWEGYLEFERLDEAAVLRTARETTQPNLTDLRYWASGLTPVYLEGAFQRAVPVPAAEHILTASNTPPLGGEWPVEAEASAAPSGAPATQAVVPLDDPPPSRSSS